MNKRTIGSIFLVILLASVLAGCAAPAAPSISVEAAWGRFAPSTPGAGAFYMLVKNTGGVEDKLISAKSPACGMAEIHSFTKKSDGSMMMILVTDPVVVPANGQVELKVGDLHVMCMKYNADQFKVGAKVDLTLVFEKSGEKKVTAEIKEQ